MFFGSVMPVPGSPDTGVMPPLPPLGSNETEKPLSDQTAYSVCGSARSTSVSVFRSCSPSGSNAQPAKT